MSNLVSANTAIRQRLWRWHFYAGLIVCPFAILLAITGAIYLFNPQIESYQEYRINETGPAIESDSEPHSYNQYLHSLLAENPDAVFRRLILNKQGDRTIEIELQHKRGDIITYWVDIFSGQVLAKKPSDQRLMQLVKKLHSELLLGNVGSYIVELMASWLIILIVSGLYLWLLQVPEQKKNALTKQLLLPETNSKSPVKRWRSFHAVLGLWFAVPITILLLSGLPWTQLWGSGFDALKSRAGWQGPGQDWFVTLKSKLPRNDKHEMHKLEHSIESAFNTGLWAINTRKVPAPTQQSDSALTDSLERGTVTVDDIRRKSDVVALYHPVHLLPPQSESGVWSVRSMSPQRSKRVTLHYDQYSGKQIMRIDFENHHPVQRFVAHSISLHEGALFGWLNQLLGVLTALAVIGVSSFGLYLWWLRKPQRAMGAPVKSNVSAPLPFIAVVLLLMVFLPAAGLSFLAILLFESSWAFVKRVKFFQ